MLTLSLMLALQITSLLHFISRTNRELVRFLDAVKYGDFSQSFQSRNSTRSFTDLGTSFDALIARFRNERSGKAEQASYLQALVQQLPIAVFSLHEDGRISLTNLACRRLFGINELTQLQQLRSFDAKLAGVLAELQPGHEMSLKVARDQTTLDLRLSCTILRNRGLQQKLVSILDIRSELEARELQAWQNLIRVMTHEIMNSITPITSLAETTGHYVQEAIEALANSERDLALKEQGFACNQRNFAQNERNSVDRKQDCVQSAHSLTHDGPGLAQHEEASLRNAKAIPNISHEEILGLLNDASNAVTTIGKRSLGLQHFVESYRSLSRLPTPQPQLFRVHELLQSICKLMDEQARAGAIVLECKCMPLTLELLADPELLEQALINLVKNSVEAVTEVAQPVITISAELRMLGHVRIMVTDNGAGISAENLENIFIPFFTTKRGGSGIGMSIVRQIVKMNGGSINVISAPGAGTTVNLDF
jgi:nitrogen fixation/metabolism regulation signal transduction histidine kinase